MLQNRNFTARVIQITQMWCIERLQGYHRSGKPGKPGKVRGKCKKVWNFEICSLP